jgi:hypothetical protein
MPLAPADLTGYVTRGLDADLVRWFPTAPRAEVPASTRPVQPFLDRLPPADAEALAAFDARVRAGTMADFCDIADWSYGFDFAGNGCGLTDDYTARLTDDDVYSVGADGGGNLYVVMHTGEVALWFHEEEVVEAHTRFVGLDVFLWSKVRQQAVSAGVLPLAEVEADFLALAQPGALVDLLPRMKGE